MVRPALCRSAPSLKANSTRPPSINLPLPTSSAVWDMKLSPAGAAHRRSKGIPRNILTPPAPGPGRSESNSKKAGTADPGQHRSGWLSLDPRPQANTLRRGGLGCAQRDGRRLWKSASAGYCRRPQPRSTAGQRTRPKHSRQRGYDVRAREHL